jgi:hypothetical protein
MAEALIALDMRNEILRGRKLARKTLRQRSKR